MQKGFLFFILICIFILTPSYGKTQTIRNGSDRIEVLLPLTKNKSIALVINHTSCLKNGTHLLDTLLSNNVRVSKIFAPEHGFRGKEDAGVNISNETDSKTGLPVISLYGKNKKPSAEMLADVDMVIFDIQDVGARFYTYISTMHYVMNACAQEGKEFIILDRPNPHDYIDGPVLEPARTSFVGIYPIPVLYGLTIGELANMANGEGWLNGAKRCNLKIVKVEGWKHGDTYSLPIKPSPNLPNDQSIRLYPSLCFFEATNVSVGRGTHFPFQVIGYPNPKFGKFSFTPRPLKGFDSNPLQKGRICYGLDLRKIEPKQGFTLSYLINFYKKMGTGTRFFKSQQFMDMLSGTRKLRHQIISGMSEDAIRKTWQNDLKKYKEKRKKYVLYQDKDYD